MPILIIRLPEDLDPSSALDTVQHEIEYHGFLDEYALSDDDVAVLSDSSPLTDSIVHSMRWDEE